MLKVEHVTFRYERRGAPVLRDASLSLETGQVGVLLGRNGCGKTTLLKTTLGLCTPEQGQILFDGQALGAMKRQQRAQVAAYVPQELQFGALRVYDAVLAGRVSRFGIQPGTADRMAAGAALAVYSHTASLFGDGLARSMVSIAESKAALGAGDAFLRGVLCNFLVCLAVWMAAASKRAEGKVIALFFPILLFVLCGYEHCIANLYYLPAGAFAAAEYGVETMLTLAGCLENLAAVTLGNLVGGAALGVGYRFAYLKE